VSNDSTATLKTRGYFLKELELPGAVRECVLARDWPALDQAIRAETLPSGIIFDSLRKYAEFSEIEFIISIRSSLEFEDEDGIWHDDGSRVLAFSLSLTIDAEKIGGGKLEIRPRGSVEGAPTQSIPTPPYGTMIVFATGHGGYEHKINRVERGERIIIAGWCT
jgi:hypothetical protein